MKKIFLLSKQNIELSKHEILSLLKTKEYDLIDNLLIVDDNSKIDFENILGFTHSNFKFLFECTKSDFLNKIKTYEWHSIYKKNFCVRIHNSNKSEKEIAEIIWDSLKKPKVNLENPKTKIEFFFVKDQIIAGLHLNDINKSYFKRKAHLRPELHPTSLHPRLARACINLTGLTKGVLLDPFCGSGGILIEAGLMGFKLIGYDFDKDQLSRAKKNLKHYKIKAKLELNDSSKLNKKVDAIVTDLPYGKGSKGDNLEKLYLKFLLSAKEVTNKMIVIFPHFINHKKIISRTQWKIKREFKDYVHKSLTRIIIKLT